MSDVLVVYLETASCNAGKTRPFRPFASFVAHVDWIMISNLPGRFGQEDFFIPLAVSGDHRDGGGSHTKSSLRSQTFSPHSLHTFQRHDLWQGSNLTNIPCWKLRAADSCDAARCSWFQVSSYYLFFLLLSSFVYTWLWIRIILSMTSNMIQWCGLDEFRFKAFRILLLALFQGNFDNQLSFRLASSRSSPLRGGSIVVGPKVNRCELFFYVFLDCWYYRYCCIFMQHWSALECTGVAVPESAERRGRMVYADAECWVLILFSGKYVRLQFVYMHVYVHLHTQ